MLNRLAKKAGVLHVGLANYCWFTDPSRALCLRLAGHTDGDRPLIGMCDSARCPQATHHPQHRAVHADQAAQTRVFLGQLGARRKAEGPRLEAEYERSVRIVRDIDTALAAATTREEEV